MPNLGIAASYVNDLQLGPPKWIRFDSVRILIKPCAGRLMWGVTPKYTTVIRSAISRSSSSFSRRRNYNNMTGKLTWFVTGCSSGMGECLVRAILAAVRK